MERKDDKSFERDIIVSISFPVLFVSTSFLVNIGKEMSLPGFRKVHLQAVPLVLTIDNFSDTLSASHDAESLSEWKLLLFKEVCFLTRASSTFYKKSKEIKKINSFGENNIRGNVSIHHEA